MNAAVASIPFLRNSSHVSPSVKMFSVRPFGAISTVGFLDNLEPQFGHTSTVPLSAHDSRHRRAELAAEDFAEDFDGLVVQRAVVRH